MQLQSDIPTGISEEFDILILKYAYKNKDLGLVRWPMPIIPALWEAEAGGSRGQEIETILVNRVKPCLY